MAVGCAVAVGGGMVAVGMETGVPSGVAAGNGGAVAANVGATFSGVCAQAANMMIRAASMAMERRWKERPRAPVLEEHIM